MPRARKKKKSTASKHAFVVARKYTSTISDTQPSSRQGSDRLSEPYQDASSNSYPNNRKYEPALFTSCAPQSRSMTSARSLDSDESVTSDWEFEIAGQDDEFSGSPCKFSGNDEKFSGYNEKFPRKCEKFPRKFEKFPRKFEKFPGHYEKFSARDEKCPEFHEEFPGSEKNSKYNDEFSMGDNELSNYDDDDDDDDYDEVEEVISDEANHDTSSAILSWDKDLVFCLSLPMEETCEASDELVDEAIEKYIRAGKLDESITFVCDAPNNDDERYYVPLEDLDIIDRVLPDGEAAKEDDTMPSTHDLLGQSVPINDTNPVTHVLQCETQVINKPTREIFAQLNVVMNGSDAAAFTVQYGTQMRTKSIHDHVPKWQPRLASILEEEPNNEKGLTGGDYENNKVASVDSSVMMFANDINTPRSASEDGENTNASRPKDHSDDAYCYGGADVSASAGSIEGANHDISTDGGNTNTNTPTTQADDADCYGDEGASTGAGAIEDATQDTSTHPKKSSPTMEIIFESLHDLVVMLEEQGEGINPDEHNTDVDLAELQIKELIMLNRVLVSEGKIGIIYRRLGIWKCIDEYFETIGKREKIKMMAAKSSSSNLKDSDYNQGNAVPFEHLKSCIPVLRAMDRVFAEDFVELQQIENNLLQIYQEHMW